MAPQVGLESTMKRGFKRLGAYRFQRSTAGPSTYQLATPRLGQVLFCHTTPRDNTVGTTRVVNAGSVQANTPVI